MGGAYRDLDAALQACEGQWTVALGRVLDAHREGQARGDNGAFAADTAMRKPMVRSGDGRGRITGAYDEPCARDLCMGGPAGGGPFWGRGGLADLHRRCVRGWMGSACEPGERNGLAGA